MKRISALFLALALCLGLAVPALAANADASAELYTYISEDFPYVNQNFEGQTRAVNDACQFDEAKELRGSFPVVPTSEYFLVGVYNMGKDEENAILIQAYSDPDGDGVYDQRLFQTKEGAKNAAVLPLPEHDAYEATGPVFATVPAAAIPGFDKVQDGEYAFSADRLHEFFGDNTLILFASEASKSVLGYVLLSAGAFDDVPGLGWYGEPVAWAADKGITVGSGDGNFVPGADCTQLQILTFLSRAAGNTNTTDYDWATEQTMVINWAKEMGMIDDSFDGSKPCTRAAAVKYIWQAFDKPSAAPSGFTDMEGYTEDYIKAADWAKEKKVTNGVSEGMFGPGTICNRAQIATFLYRAYNN